MFNPFRKKPAPSLDEQVIAAIDEVNRLIPQLPHGTSFWMQWRPFPQLTLSRRQQAVTEQLYP